MRVQGTIPEEITIVSSVEQPVYRQWEGEEFADDIVDDDEGEIVKFDERREMVIPAFPIQSGNVKTLKTAIEWAERHRQWYDPETKKHLKKTDPVVQDTRKNEPMTKIQVVALEERGNGGRAYKVKTNEKYYFDMREDVMLDAMITEGITKGGYLNGKFIFGRVGSQMKLVRIGSELHKALQKAVVANNTKKLDAKDFQVGDVFETKSGKQKVFCGWVSTGNFMHSCKIKGSSGSRNMNYSYIYVDKFSYTKMPKAMLWMDSWSTYGKPDFEKELKNCFKNNYSLDVSASHTVIKKLGSTTVVPPNIIQTVSLKAMTELKQAINRCKGDSSSHSSYEDTNGNKITPVHHEIMNAFSRYDAKKALMVPFGTEYKIPIEFSKCLTLVTK